MKTDANYLLHIVDACDWIIKLAADGEEMFLTDVKTQDSCIRKLEIIGEAASKVTNDLREHHPEVPWRLMVGLRNRLIHEYLGVDLGTIWQTASESIPKLRADILLILKQEEQD